MKRIFAKFKPIFILTIFFIIFGVGFMMYNFTNGNRSSPVAVERTLQKESMPEGERVMQKELLFVEDAENNEVIVLSVDGNVIKKIKVGKEPHDIAVSPDQRFVATGNFRDGTVSIINTQTLSVEKTLKTGKGAHGVAFDPRGNFLFVANSKDSTLSVIETSTFSKQTKIYTGNSPEYVGVTKDGANIFTTDLGDKGSVTILTNKGFQSKILKTVALGIDTHGWAVSPDGKEVLITNLDGSTAYFLDAVSFKKTYYDMDTPTEFAAFLNNDELWLTNIATHYVSIVDRTQNRIVDRIKVGETPHGITFSNDKSLAFAALYEPGEIVILDVSERKIIKRVKVGDKLHNSVVVQLRLW